LDKFKSIAGRGLDLLTGFSSMIFDRTLEKRNPAGPWIWLVFLYITGLLWWGSLLGWQKAPLNFHDWYVVFFPRYDAVRDALDHKMLPLHVECGVCLHGMTDRFFMIPDVVTTPQMLLLSVMDVDTFAILDLLFHYTLATLGLILLRQKLQLSLLSYSFLFFLFNFNGYIQAHYAVGHLSWGGYFLFPFYFLLVFQLFDQQPPTWKWVASMAFLSFYMILAGSQHHFTWLMLFLVFLAVTHRLSFKWIAAAILFSGFLSAVRLLPPALGLDQFGSFHFRFRSGYHTLYDFWSALVMIRRPDFVEPEIVKYTTLGYWEFDYFVSLIGAFFIIYFGVIDWSLKGEGKFRKYFPLIVPALALFILSQGQIYKHTLFDIPLFSSERVISRMISVPLTFFMIMAAAQFQQFLELNTSRAVRWLAAGGLLMLINELRTHTLLWKVKVLGKFFEAQDMQFTGNSIINHPDPEYFGILIIGLALTLITSILLGVLVLRERRGSHSGNVK
jgi:hypothetical protein